MISAQQERDRARQNYAGLAEHVGPAAVASAQLPAHDLGPGSAANSDAVARGHLETIAALESQVKLELFYCVCAGMQADCTCKRQTIVCV